MKRTAPLMICALLAAPVSAEDVEEPGLSLMERGALLFMEGILKEMEPAIDELSELSDEMGPALRKFAEDMGPKLTDLLAEVEDWSAYQAPEILSNGDIIIRRKEPPIGVVPKLPQKEMPEIDL